MFEEEEASWCGWSILTEPVAENYVLDMGNGKIMLDHDGRAKIF